MKAKKGGGPKKAAWWEGAQGWRPVEVGDDVLLGSEEFGFAGLEELDPSMLGKRVRRAEPQAGGAGRGRAAKAGAEQYPAAAPPHP